MKYGAAAAGVRPLARPRPLVASLRRRLLRGLGFDLVVIDVAEIVPIVAVIERTAFPSPLSGPIRSNLPSAQQTPPSWAVRKTGSGRRRSIGHIESYPYGERQD